jgi:hypothetical protein
MIYKMSYCLHENKGDFLEQISGSDLDEALSEIARSELNYAFYEVELNVEINTDTGKITIIEVVQ